jgi:Fe(3+) dicitrate transport protein
VLTYQKVQGEIPIKTYISAIGILAVSLVSVAWGADLSDPMIKEVTIIGTKEEKKSLSGSGMQISAAELRRHGYSDLNQIVSSVPGVYVREEDGYGLRPNIGIRGATSERSQKITLMEDGVLIAPAPYSAPAAYYITNASRLYAVEVLKGPSAIQTGPHTVGGAINLVTRPVPLENITEIDVSAGTDGYHKLAGTVGYVIDNVGVLIEGFSYGSDGFKRLDGGGDTGFKRNDVNLKVRWQPRTELPQTLIVKIGFADEDADETYLGLTDTDFAITPKRRYSASQLDRFQSEHRQIHLHHSILLNTDLELTSKLYFNEYYRSWNKFDGFMDGPKVQDVLGAPTAFVSAYRTLQGLQDSVVGDYSDLTIDVTDNDREYTSQGLQFDLNQKLDLLGVEHKITVGLRYHQDDVRRRHQTQSYLMTSGNMISDGISRLFKTNNYAQTDAFALSVSDDISWSDWTFNIGVRHEDISGSVDNKLLDTLAENTQMITTPGIGVYRKLTDSIGVLAGIYMGFSPSGPGQSGAESEESVNIEYGIRYTRTDFSGELIVFKSDYDNLLGRCRASDSDCQVGQEFSGGNVEVSGIEVIGQGQYEFGDTITLTSQINYTYSESKFKSSFFSQFSQWGLVNEGDELPYVPKHAGKWQVGLESDLWALDLAVKYQHGMRETPGFGDITEGLHTDNMTTVDASATWFVNEDVDVKILARNLTDDSSIVSHRPYGARPNLPRTILGQVKYRF